MAARAAPRADDPERDRRLDAIPVTPHGKVDLAALPVRRRSAPPAGRRRVAIGHRRPPGPAVGRDTRRGAVGPDDNFFELGGDSILSIKLVSEQPSRACSSRPSTSSSTRPSSSWPVVVSTTRQVEAEQGTRLGDVALTPVQRWFFEQAYAEPHHFNQAALVPVPRTVNLKLLARAMRAVVGHHDALHLRFAPGAVDGTRTGRRPPTRCRSRRPTCPHISADAVPAALERACNRLQSGLSFTDGPLVRVGAARPRPRPPPAPARRHPPSRRRRCVLADPDRGPVVGLCAAGRRPARAVAAARPRRSSSGRALDAGRPRRRAAVAQRPNSGSTAAGRCAGAPARPARRDNASHVTPRAGGLGGERPTVLHRSLAERKVEINDVLVSAAAHAVGRWTGGTRWRWPSRAMGASRCSRCRSVAHRRLVHVDPPVVVRPADADAVGAARRIPDRGIGYGVLRYLSPDARLRQRLAAAPWPEVVFNYLGRCGSALVGLQL